MKGKIEKVDPRLRLIICFVYSIIVAIEKNLDFIKYFSILPFFLLFFIENFKNFLKNFFIINFFILFFWVFLPFNIPGKPLYKIFIFSGTVEGVKYALLITFKTNLIFITNFVLIFSSHPFKIIHALHHLHLPEKLINILFLTARYIPVIENELNKIFKSLKARSFKFRTNLHTYKTIGNLVGILILRSYLKSDRIYKAMLLRSFSGTFWIYNHFEWKKKDTLFSIMATIYFLWILILKIMD
ncbi:MAG: cobalt ECF transporter T component CbiQ [Candidatus Omnitrophica bacterium]|nr:cobalt ECF transporter T component CbiQ [Candidatus Omnitrophota bacterium]MCM8806601.1 cobalt ECF transporter T component CbiQ [Candidatus Omnitrophota bacterium]